MAIFDTFDRTGVAEFQFPREVVFKAVEQAVQVVKGMKISDSSSTAGFLHIKAGVSAMSWGETVKVSVISSGPWLAQVQVASAGKTFVGSLTTHGKNQKNISALIRATAAVLDRNGEKWATEMGMQRIATEETATRTPLSKADELKKLAELRDQGILTEAEFTEQKAHLLRD
jgi:hypothetical protein